MTNNKYEGKKWGDRRGLNPRPSAPQADALPTELRSPEGELDLKKRAPDVN